MHRFTQHQSAHQDFTSKPYRLLLKSETNKTVGTHAQCTQRPQGQAFHFVVFPLKYQHTAATRLWGRATASISVEPQYLLLQPDYSLLAPLEATVSVSVKPAIFIIVA